jgi:NAD+ kinase
MNSNAPGAAMQVGITFNPRLDGAAELASSLRDRLQRLGLGVWLEQEDGVPSHELLAKTQRIICLGGDGTVLRCARMVTGLDTLIVGVNMGRLGFLTEMAPEDINEHLDEIIEGQGRIEERTLVTASVPRTGETFTGLNEAVVGRATLSRAIQLAVDVDGTRIADYRCDGVIVASATGSTAYALSVGGPILMPESSDLVIVPVAPHLAAQHAVVVPGTESVHITLEPRQQAVLSLDGLSDHELTEGDSVIVTASQRKARFLRLSPRSDFYVRMAAQLGWHRPGGNARPLPATEPLGTRGKQS